MGPTWWRLRGALLIGCVAALPVVAWRGLDVAAEMRHDREAAVAYQRGVTLQVAGRYDEAAAAFREAIAVSPRATAAYEGLGDVEFRRGRIDDAITAYRQLMVRYPYTYLSELHRQVGLMELRGGRLTEAIRDLDEAVTLDPQDWLALHVLANAYDRLGDTASARRAWEGVLRLNPGFRPARDHLSRLDGQHH